METILPALVNLLAPMDFAQTINVDATTSESIAKLGTAIVDRGLATPALLFLEMHRPLLTLAYNLAIFAEPLAVPLFGFEKVRAYREILQSPEHLNALINQIEMLRDVKK